MNKVILVGRLTREPEMRSTADGSSIANYTLAVDRRSKDQAADFISCKAFGKSAEFVEKYLHKGTKIAITGRIQTGSYQKADGTKVYTTDVIADEHEFVESKAAQAQDNQSAISKAQNSGFVNFDDLGLEELPFN